MNALATALFTAGLALFGKIAFDLWARLRERRGIAAALAGEIGAFIGIMIRMNAAQNFAAMTTMPTSLRQSVLPGLNKTPSKFHIFEALTDRIGVLPPDLIADIVEFYNAFESFRIMVNNFSEPGFVAAPIFSQDAAFAQVSTLLDRYASSFILRDRLHRVVRQDIWCLFIGHS